MKIHCPSSDFMGHALLQPSIPRYLGIWEILCFMDELAKSSIAKQLRGVAHNLLWSVSHLASCQPGDLETWLHGYLLVTWRSRGERERFLDGWQWKRNLQEDRACCLGVGFNANWTDFSQSTCMSTLICCNNKLKVLGIIYESRAPMRAKIKIYI